MKTAKPTPTADQIAAVKAFAELNGRTWKQALRYAWYSGDYRYAYGKVDTALLQQLRNNFGPRWLNAFRLENRA